METIETLFDIVKTLRGKNGCEWDQKQTPETMMPCLEEEVYELQEAIAKKDQQNICEELGDVLFQLVFIIQIFQEQNQEQDQGQEQFTFSDVIEQVSKKMIRRHPHVYGDARVDNHDELIEQWETIKAGEKGKDSRKNLSALDNVPKGMPSLIRALKVSKCAVKEGFDWENIHQVLDTVRSEIDEFESALDSGDRNETVMEFGDILFSLVNVARTAKFHPETALSNSTAKFEGRFRRMEGALDQKKLKLKDLDRAQKDLFWEEAKASYDV